MLFLAACLGEGCKKKGGPRPSLIVITLDTLRQDHLSAYGYYRETSPAIEAFARDSVTFERAYAPLPSTWPSHFSMMTSTPPAVLGTLCNGQKPSSDNAEYLARHLKGQGYATAAIIGSEVFRPGGGIETGFDLFDNKIPKRRDPKRKTRPNKFARGADAVVDLSIEWIKNRDPERPFFIWMHFWDAHGPYYAPPDYLNRYKLDDEMVEIMKQRRQSAIFEYNGKTYGHL